MFHLLFSFSISVNLANWTSLSFVKKSIHLNEVNKLDFISFAARLHSLSERPVSLFLLRQKTLRKDVKYFYVHFCFPFEIHLFVKIKTNCLLQTAALNSVFSADQN
jgi:hypothetical protein